MAGYLLTPLAVWAIALGLGLLLERLARVRLPNALLVPLGFCVAVSLCLGVYKTGAGDAVLLPILCVLVLAGFVLALRELPGRLNGGWPLLAGAAAFVLFDLSAIATGHWTFGGYKLQDDVAYELLLAHHMQAYGTSSAGLPTDTASSFISSFLATGYPLGAQAFLAALGGLVRSDLASIWQGYLSALAGVGAMAAATISGRSFDRRVGALVGLLAMAAALTYQYAMQGSIKEIGAAVSVLCAIALIRHAILELRGLGAAVVVAVPLAAILVVYNAAGLPYAAGLAGSALLGALLVHRRAPTLRWVRPTLAGGALFALFALPALTTLMTFLRVSKALYTGAHAQALPLGQLLRSLPVSEVAGVWLAGDYRVPVGAGLTGEAELVATVLILVLLALGAVHALWRREPGPLLGVVTMALVLLIVYPRAIPYAQAKLLAIASPVVVLGAAQGLAALRRLRLTPLAALVGVALGGLILLSDALAYHHDPVAPTSRLLALREAGRKLGSRGPVLMSEFEEFAKYFTQPARLYTGTEYPTPENLVLLAPGGLYDQSFDLDAEQLSFVESFPYLLVRRSASTSRPPANYDLMYANAYYEVWRREVSPRVLAHLPLQLQYVAYAPVPCQALAAFVRTAPADSRLEVAESPPAVGYDVLHATVRSDGWIPDPNQYTPDAITPLTPGSAGKIVAVPGAGTYRVWVQGTFPRPIRVTVDGRTVGSVQGQNTPDEWLAAGRVRVGAGRHALDLFRGGGGLEPGDGGTGAADGKGSIGYVAMVAEQPERTSVLALGHWHELCGRDADWVELVSG